MKPSFNGTLGRGLSFTDSIRVASEAGFTYIDGDIHAIEQMDWNEVLSIFQKYGVSMSSMGLPVDVHGTEEKFQEDLKKLPGRARLALALGAKSSCTWLWPSIDELPVPYASRLAKRFRACAEVLSAFGLRLGLEFVGPHHLRNKRYPFVYTLADTLDYIGAVGAPNVGLLLDSYHWYTSEGTVDDLLQIPAELIALVHVNDTDKSPSEALDGERLLPGEGRIDLTAFFGALHTIKYTGPVSIEVLRQTPFSEPADVVAKTAFTATQTLIENSRRS